MKPMNSRCHSQSGEVERKFERRGACARRRVLRFARKLALRMGRRHAQSLCTADDVVDGIVRAGHMPNALGCAMSSVFRTPHWRATRLRVRSRRPRNRGRELTIWHLREDTGCPQAPHIEVTLDPRYALLVERYLPRLSTNGNGNGAHAAARPGIEVN